MENQAQPIETRELRGVTVKTALIIICCTISMIVTVMGTFYSLKGDITELRTSKDSEAKLNDLKMRVMDQKIDMQGIQIRDLIKKFEDETSKK